MIRIMARVSARPETAAEVGALLAALVAPSRAEAGCLRYEVYADEDDPADFITVEEWADAAAVDAHMASPHVGAAIARAGPLLAAAPLIHRFRRLA